MYSRCLCTGLGDHYQGFQDPGEPIVLRCFLGLLKKWDVSLHDCLLIWRGGCIIQSGQSNLFHRESTADMVDGISEFLIPLLKPFGPSQPLNLKADIPEVAAELSKTYESLKKIYTTCIQTDAVAPAIGATLEWLKAVGGKNLPTDFEEMELDCESSTWERSADGRFRSS